MSEAPAAAGMFVRGRLGLIRRLWEPLISSHSWLSAETSPLSLPTLCLQVSDKPREETPELSPEERKQSRA